MISTAPIGTRVQFFRHHHSNFNAKIGTIIAREEGISLLQFDDLPNPYWFNNANLYFLNAPEIEKELKIIYEQRQRLAHAIKYL